MALSIGDLVAYLRADDTALRSGLQGAQSKIKSFASGAKAALAAGGAVAGAALASGIAGNLNIGAGRAKLAAQLDLSKADSARIGKVAGQVYADNWGENLGAVNDAVRAVATNIGSVSRMSSGDLRQVAEGALAIADTFNVDVNDATRAAGKLMKSGLAKDSQQAMDIVTKGFQVGLDSSGDFLDTLNEYSPQFAKLGLAGDQVLSILSAGLKGGARDTDAIADAFKEFSIRAIDGSTTTAKGFKALGLNAKTASEAIAKGGPSAAAMTQTVLESLSAIKDPVKQNAAGVALFGTQWEDTVRKTLPQLKRAEGGMEDVKGATQRMADTAGSSGAAKIETLKRGFEQWTQSMTSSDSAMGGVVAGVLAFGAPALAMGGQLGMIVSGLGVMNAGAVLGAIKTGVLAAATGVATAAQWLWNAALSANPIGLIIMAIAAFVVAIVILWKKNETFRAIVTAAWNGIKAVAAAVFGWMMQYIPTVWRVVLAVTKVVWAAIRLYVTTYIRVIVAVVRSIIAVVNIVRSAWTGAYAAVRSVVGAMVGFVRGIPGKIKGALGGLGNLLYGAGRQVIQGLINGIRSMVGSLAAEARKALGVIGKLLPGSPVKEGPLRVLNNGYAGRQIIAMVAGGVSKGRGALDRSMRDTLSGSRLTPGSSARGAAGGLPAGRYHSVLELRGDGANRWLVEALRAALRKSPTNDVQVLLGGKA